MITRQSIRDIHGTVIELPLSVNQEDIIQPDTGLTLLPALIDPHVHFRTPGLEHTENWRTAALAAIRGGYTTVFDMPNTIPPTITKQLLHVIVVW